MPKTSQTMPKRNQREVRSMTRQLFKTRQDAEVNVRKLLAVSKEASTIKKRLVSMNARNTTLSKNVRTIYDMFLKQQVVIHRQQVQIRHLHANRNPVCNDNEDCAKSMIALSQQLCRNCLGTRTILKTKKHIRYSTECKVCKI